MKLVKRSVELPKNEKEEFKATKVYGFARIKGKVKPLYACRTITKGPDKGKLLCTYLYRPKKYRTIRLNRSQIDWLDRPFRKKGHKLVKREGREE
jgi:hypothetical protein